MKRLLIVILGLCLAFRMAAQERHLSALFNYNMFYLADSGKPYVETYLSFDAWTLHFVPVEGGKYRATVELTIVVSQDDSVVYAKKYELNSPAIADTNQTDFNFIDLQRFYLNNGIYTLQLTARDKASQQQPVSLTEKFSVFFDRTKPSMTKPQLMASAKRTEHENILSRNGYDMEPYLSDYLPEEITQMNIYYEIYNIDQELGEKPFLSYIFVEEQATGRQISDIQHVARHQPGRQVPAFATMDISQLASGNYNLVVELRDRDNNTLLYQRLPFYRSNPSVKPNEVVTSLSGTFAEEIADEDKMNMYLDALYPIASDAERSIVKGLLATQDLEGKQMFLYNFWLTRYGGEARDHWLEYQSWIEYVNREFSYPNMPGYRSDRGRVYLQYGPPDYIRDEKNFVSALRLGSGTDDNTRRIVQNGEVVGVSPLNPQGGHSNPSLGHIHYLPYQLWRYNKLDADDANRVFLFWDEFRSGLYKLLVSNARGETLDPLWERRLSQQQLEEYVVGEVGEQFNRGH